MKQQHYDWYDDSTCLSIRDISQACAKQRAGRAGRTRNGFCHRLYSQEQYDAMEKYTAPEIVRVPLTEIALNAKILAGVSSVENFLMKAIQPPPVENIRRSLEILKMMNALDENEHITILGRHLICMPIDCRLGVILLYSIVMQCIDPIVTIVR